MTSSRGAYSPKKPVGPPATLGQRIRAVRLSWGWTQVALAKALGSVQHSLSEWEKDISRPSGATLTAMARLFQLSVAALETGKGFKLPEPPDAKPQGGRMSKRDVQELKQLLPRLKEGEILQVDTGTSGSELVELTEALAALSEAKRAGRPVWLVIGEASKKGQKQ